MKQSVFAVACAALLAGCFTVHHSEFPEVAMSRLPEGRDVKVALAGFEATVTSYLPVHNYTTVWDDGPRYYRHGRRGAYYGPHTETWSSTTYIPQVNQDNTYIKFATDTLEAAGCIVASTNFDYVVDVSFSGPVITNTDRAVEALWIVLSLLSADYSAQEWTARMKIRDGATGKVLLMRDYTEKCSVAVWGPLPIFSPLSASDTTDNSMQAWTLSALTSRAMADATAFLAADVVEGQRSKVEGPSDAQ